MELVSKGNRVRRRSMSCCSSAAFIRRSTSEANGASGLSLTVVPSHQVCRSDTRQKVRWDLPSLKLVFLFGSMVSSGRPSFAFARTVF